MSLTGTSPVRLFTTLSLSMVLAVTMFAGYTVSPAAPKASAALISAAKADAAVQWARTRKGMPYSYGANGPTRFDCSGLTQWVFAKVGKSLPHSSSAQVSKTERVKRENRRRGDLVFFYSRSGIYHVAIYAGRGEVWHASRPGTPVRRSDIWTGNVFYGRVK